MVDSRALKLKVLGRRRGSFQEVGTQRSVGLPFSTSDLNAVGRAASVCEEELPSTMRICL